MAWVSLGQPYVDAVFPAESKVAMQHLVENPSQALKARLEQLPWMAKKPGRRHWRSGPASPRRSATRTSGVTGRACRPTATATWATCRRRVFNYRYMLDKIGKPVDKTEWGMTPQTVNAYYNATKNEIVSRQRSCRRFFDAKADPALNYGGIGAVIGHEMMHGYDDSGSQFAANANSTTGGPTPTARPSPSVPTSWSRSSTAMKRCRG